MKLSLLRQVFFTTFVVGTMATIVACQSLPEPPAPQPVPEKPHTVTTPEGVVIRPYEREEIKRQSSASGGATTEGTTKIRRWPQFTCFSKVDAANPDRV